MTTRIFAIRNTLTGEFISYNGKCAWAKAGNAKLAFRHHERTNVKFDDQDEYEIVELTTIYNIYQELFK